jgi:peptidoglycan/LPS O-acetylase OafA/YrhL
VNRLFVEPGEGFFTSWINFIVYIVLLLILGWLFYKFFETKFGKITKKGINKVKNPIVRWYDNLPYRARNIVGWMGLAVYCLGIVTIFIWLQT